MNYLEKNLEVLARINPPLARWIIEEPDRSWIKTTPGQNGNPGLVLDLPSGTLDVYESGDPVEFTVRQLRRSDLVGNSKILLLGIGLGYAIDQFLERLSPGDTVVAAEIYAHLIRLTLARADYREALISRRLVLVGPDEKQLEQTLGQVPPAPTDESTLAIYAERYADQMGSAFLRLKDLCWSTLITLAAHSRFNRQFGLKVARNFIRALPRAARRPEFKELEGAYGGVPAILVTTGPSLGKNIRALRRAQGRALIISAGQALRPLLAYGIKPDFVSFVDIFDMAIDHLKGLFGVRGIPLVVPNSSCSRIINRWQGSWLLSATDGNLTGLLHEFWKTRSGITQGANISQFNLHLADFLGADPIILVGQDLAVSDEETHFAQADQKLKMEVGRNDEVHVTIDDPDTVVEGAVSRGRMELVPGYFGGMVKTLQPYYIQIREMESSIMDRSLKVVNSTEGGARIGGTTRMKLSEAIETYCTSPVSSARAHRLGQPGPDRDPALDRILELLELKVGEVREVVRNSRRWIKLEAEVRKAEARLAATGKGGQRLAQARDRVEEVSLTLNKTIKAIPELSYALTGEMEGVTTARNQAVPGDPETGQKVVEASRNLVRATIEKGTEIGDGYRDDADRLEDYLAAREEFSEAPRGIDPLIRLIGTLEALGEVGEACDLLVGELGKQPGSPRLGAELGRLAILNENYPVAVEALEYLRKFPEAGAPAEDLAERLKEIVEEKMARSEEDLAADMFARPVLAMRQVLEIEPANERAAGILEKCEAELEAQAAAAEAKAAALWASEGRAADPADPIRPWGCSDRKSVV